MFLWKCEGTVSLNIREPYVKQNLSTSLILFLAAVIVLRCYSIQLTVVNPCTSAVTDVSIATSLFC